MPVDKTYYDLLGVAPACEETELRRAYKKKALQLHPDKGGDPELFAQMKSAYDVLSDPKKRKMYDSYGIEGLKVMEGNLSPEAMMIVLTRSGKFVVVGMLSGLTLAVLSPVILFALRWDNTVDWPWFIAFIPIWILQALILAILVVVLRGPPAPPPVDGEVDEEAQAEHALRKRTARIAGCSGCLVLLLFVVFEVFLVLRLEYTVTFSWFIVVLPWLFLEVGNLTMTIVYSRSMLEEAKAESNKSPCTPPPPGLVFFLLQRLLWGVLRIFTVILMAARADEAFKGSWYLCMIPLMTGALVRIVDALVIKVKFRAEQARRRVPGREATEEDVQEPGAGICGAFCIIIFQLTIVCGVAGKLDGAEYSAWLVFLPILLLVFCCMCCLPVLMVIATQGQASPDPSHGPSPGVAATSGAAVDATQFGSADPEAGISLSPEQTSALAFMIASAAEAGATEAAIHASLVDAAAERQRISASVPADHGIRASGPENQGIRASAPGRYRMSASE